MPPAAVTPAPPPPPTPALDTAWRIHTAVAEWTGRVDTKASVVLTLEMAVLAGLVTLSTGGRGLPGDIRPGLFWCGALLFVAAAACAVMVVMPRMRARHVPGEAATNFVYFGHLRLWDPAALAGALTSGVLEVLVRDIVACSAIAWRKHRLLQLSIVIASAGGLLLLLALVLAAGG
ncbi:Pycsar system effector family protein [Streptomyces virginiae]|uniref:Pycsar system effector family protein n=1 Tax=Streptomyces virginiae TaxID=1961 RepID=UPI00378A064B